MTSPRAAWLRVAQDICDQIQQGLVEVGDQIPSQGKLTQRHDVALGTVRQAINHLTAAGLLKGQPGRGVYVLRMPEASDLGPQKSVEDRVAALEKASIEHTRIIAEQGRTIDDLRGRLTQLEERGTTASTEVLPG